MKNITIIATICLGLLLTPTLARAGCWECTSAQAPCPAG